MADNEALNNEQSLFKIMLISYIKDVDNVGYSSEVFWGIVRICHENYDRLEKRKDD